LGYIPYDDGTVYYNDSAAATSDGKRPNQSTHADVDGLWRTYTTITSTTGASTTVISGVFLPYDATGNTTRNWRANNATQIGTNPNGTNYVDMSTYATTNDSANVQAKSSATPGIEIQYGRVIQRFKHLEWGINASLGFSVFNAKTSQSIAANAIKYTDRYQVYQNNPATGGLVPGKVYNGSSVVNSDGSVATSGTNTGQIISGPSFVDMAYTDADGNTTSDVTPNIFSGGYEVTTPLGIGVTNPSYAPQQLDRQTGVINGSWQVKGKYYLFRIGPMIRVPIGQRFSAAVSAGYLAAQASSDMSVSETLAIPGIITKTTDNVSAHDKKFLSGMYVDANFEWWISTHTGFYAGLVFEKLSNYTQQSQQYAWRVATVKMDDGLGAHFGIITRF